MTRLTSIALIISLMLAVAGTLIVSSATADDTKPIDDRNAFAGKVVTIYQSGTKSAGGHILVDVELKEICGRMILVGTGAETGRNENWAAGIQVGIAWDTVDTYFAMTHEQFNATVKDRVK